MVVGTPHQKLPPSKVQKSLAAYNDPDLEPESHFKIIRKHTWAENTQKYRVILEEGRKMLALEV